MILLVLAYGCGKPSDSDSGSSGLEPVPPVEVAGTWTGTWTGDNGSGAIELTLVQSGSNVTGTSTFIGFTNGRNSRDCFSTHSFPVGELSGKLEINTVDAAQLFFLPVITTPNRNDPNGRDIIEFQKISASGEFKVLGNRLLGSYKVINGLVNTGCTCPNTSGPKQVCEKLDPPIMCAELLTTNCTSRMQNDGSATFTGTFEATRPATP